LYCLRLAAISMMIVLKRFGVVCWFANLGGLIYLFNVGWSHAGIDWHGMPTIIWLAGILSMILAGSALLAWWGKIGIAVLLAAAPGILAIATLAVVLGIYLFAGGRPN
jgi:hypothetical protein